MPEPLTLLDSRALLGDSTALRERMARQGYLFFPGLLDPGELGRLRDEVLDRLAALGWLAPGSDPREALPGPDISREGDERWWPAYIAIQELEGFHRLAHQAGLVDVMRPLVGDEVLVHPRKIARVTYPGSDHPTPAHQDFPLLQGAPDTFTAWIPLCDCGPDMGALRVLEGSHLSGMQRIGPKAGVGGIGVDVLDDDPRWRTAEYALGDVLLFHSLTVHRAPANRARRLRLSVDYRYQALGEPITEASIRPHQWPQVPDWPELTGGWTTTDWVDAPPGVTVVPFLHPLEHELTEPVSRILSPAGG